MSIYLGKNKVSIKYNASADKDQDRFSQHYHDVCKKVDFCKTEFQKLGGKGEYAGAWFALRPASLDYENFDLSDSYVKAIRTSDGGFYTSSSSSSVTHHWDDTKDFAVEGVVGQKYRWVIYYYSSDMINSNSEWLDCKKSHNVVYVFDMDMKYYLLTSGTTDNAYGLCRNNVAVQSFDFINDHYCTSTSPTNFRHFCWHCTALTKLPDNLDTSLATQLMYFCYQCYSLEKLPDALDTKNCTTFSYFCGYCSSLKELPQSLDMSSVYDMDYFCYQCRSLRALPANLNTVNCRNFKCFCANCDSLSYVPDCLDTSNATDMSLFFGSCYSLQKLPSALNTSNCKNFQYFCMNCYALERLPPGIDTTKATSLIQFCANCWSLAQLPDVIDARASTNMTDFCLSAKSLKHAKILLPASSVTTLNASGYLSVESMKFMSDNAPVTAGATLTIGNENITRANAYDPTIISNLNAKGWTVN